MMSPHSDHKLIRFSIQQDNTKHHRYILETKHGKQAKFDKNMKKIKNKYY